MKKVFLLFIAVLFLLQTSIAQNITKSEYIQLYKDFAVREMKRMGVPAAITLAQGILETENGNSILVKKSNNHFGIKCKSTWTAEGVSHDDDAFGECFRKYKHAEDSYRDHSNFLRGSERYAFLFRLHPADYKGWAYGLKKAGYATNPRYPQILIKFIEENNLQQYTLLAVNEIPYFDASSNYESDHEDKAFKELTNKTVNGNDRSAANNEVQNIGLQFENKTTINGSTAIPAVKGKSLLAIATENNVNLLKLLEYNDLEKDGLLEKDQFIFLERKSKEGEKDFYIIQQDESLYDVAQKNGIRLQSLYEYNTLRPDEKVYAGAKLNLKSLMSDPIILKEEITGTEEKVHAVQPKEGLYAISKRYGVTVLQIKKWNNLPDDNLKVGQQLIISKNNMELLQVHDKQFKPFISAAQIHEQIKRVAAEINNDYKNKRPLFIAILNGAFMFASDLFKEISIEAEICFIKLASYKGVTSTGQVVTAIGLDIDLVERDVIILEDIVDTGKTLSHFLPQLNNHNPTSLKITALLQKPEALIYPIKIDYLGFAVPNKFLLGYGLDYDGLGRNIKEIYQLV